MADRRFRQEQWEGRYDPHVLSINQLVDRLGQERGERIPYVAPHYGGVDAEVLFIFQDPGPGTDDSRAGSGFLCCENDDPSAQLLAECLDAVGLDPARVITWNAYPWALPEGRTSLRVSDLELGLEPFKQLISLLPKLRVIAPMGRMAQESWSRFRRRYPKIAARYQVIPGLHTSGRGITSGGQHSRAEGIARVKNVMQAALNVIGPVAISEQAPAEALRTAPVRPRTKDSKVQKSNRIRGKRAQGNRHSTAPRTSVSTPPPESVWQKIARRLRQLFSTAPSSS